MHLLPPNNDDTRAAGLATGEAASAKVPKQEVSARKTWLRASSLRGSSINGDEEGEEGRDGDWSLERFGGGNNGKSGGGNKIEMENPMMEAAKKRRGNKSNAKVQNQGEITKKKEEEAGLELEMTAVSGAGDGDDDDDVSVSFARRTVPEETRILGGGWTACIDDASGETYYHQEGTGKVQWELPAETVTSGN